MKYLTRESKNITIRKDDVTSEDTYEGDIGYQHLGGEGWKLDVGSECNVLLEQAEHLESINPDQPVSKVYRSIVARVAEFESLEKEEE